ncbi:LmeA family phospholipid-binding protein [Gordonia sp. NPDC003424]
MSRFAVNKAAGVDRRRGSSSTSQPHRRTRRIAGIGIVTILVVAAIAVLTDTIVAMRSEASFSQALRASPRVIYDPEVTLGGFPFLTHAAAGEFPGAVITARGVPVACPGPGACHAELDATLTSLSVSNGFKFESSDLLHTASASAYTRLDSVNLGRFLGIVDLTVNTPAPEGKAGAGGPGDGLLRRTRGVLLTGTVPLPPVDTSTRFPPSASAYPGPKVKVSVVADLSVADGRLRIDATDFYRGPEEHVDADVPADLRTHVLAQFTATLPALPSPWNIAPRTAYSEGSDVVLEGRQGAADLRPDQF